MNLLFLCTGNSCRSQIAEGWTHEYNSDCIQVQSAGIEAHGQNPRAVAVMQEVGIDITDQESTILTDDMLDSADYLVTVCEHADKQCPELHSGMTKEHWPLLDPAKASGSEEEIMEMFRKSRNDIQQRVNDLLSRLENKTNDKLS